jgi:hypothetical protein
VDDVDAEVGDVAVQQEREDSGRDEQRATSPVLEGEPGEKHHPDGEDERCPQHVAHVVRADLAEVLRPQEQDRVDPEQDRVDAAEQTADRDPGRGPGAGAAMAARVDRGARLGRPG